MASRRSAQAPMRASAAMKRASGAQMPAALCMRLGRPAILVVSLSNHAATILRPPFDKLRAGLSAC